MKRPRWGGCGAGRAWVGHLAVTRSLGRPCASPSRRAPDSPEMPLPEGPEPQALGGGTGELEEGWAGAAPGKEVALLVTRSVRSLRSGSRDRGRQGHGTCSQGRAGQTRVLSRTLARAGAPWAPCLGTACDSFAVIYTSTPEPRAPAGLACSDPKTFAECETNLCHSLKAAGHGAEVRDGVRS